MLLQNLANAIGLTYKSIVILKEIKQVSNFQSWQKMAPSSHCSINNCLKSDNTTLLIPVLHFLKNILFVLEAI